MAIATHTETLEKYNLYRLINGSANQSYLLAIAQSKSSTTSVPVHFWQLFEFEVLEGKQYRHYKGNIYVRYPLLVLDWSYPYQPFTDDSGDDRLVLYQDVSDLTKAWLHPWVMFVDKVEVNGEMVPRFQEIE